MFLANVIFATMVPYVMVVMFCFIVLPVEVTIFYGMQRPAVGFWAACGLILGANIASWIGGVVIMRCIPVPAEFMTHESLPAYFGGMVMGYVGAFFLSWWIEYWFIGRFAKRYAFRRLARTVGFANFASYAGVFAAMILKN